jgi:hypothetical protein
MATDANRKEAPGKEKKETKTEKKTLSANSKRGTRLLASNAYLLSARNQRSGPKRITGNFSLLLLYFRSIIHYSCCSRTIRGIQSKHIPHGVQMSQTRQTSTTGMMSSRSSTSRRRRRRFLHLMAWSSSTRRYNWN